MTVQLETDARGHLEDAKVFFGCGHCSQVFMDTDELRSHTNHWHQGQEYRCIPAKMPKRMTDLLHRPHSSSISAGIPLSEVARHNTPENCWVALNGKVYDMTEFLGRHPGGRSTILAWAGKDASTFFNNVHHSSWIQQYLRPEAFLGDILRTEENSYDGLVSDSYWHKLREARISEIRHELQDIVSSMIDADADCHPSARMELKFGGDKTSTSPFTCLHCQQGFPAKVYLDNHIENDHHGMASGVIADIAMDHPIPVNATSAGHIVCGYCGTDTASPSELEFHTKSAHAGATILCMKRSSQCLHTELGAESNIPLSEVAKHNTTRDCWIAINGDVYDFTDTLKQAPESQNALLQWAGRDASIMWDRIPGRFPSTIWAEHHIRPEQWMGKVGQDCRLSAREALLRELQSELKRLEGPSKEAQAAAQQSLADRGAEPVPGAGTELERFPKLKEIIEGKGPLPQYTRAEVAKHVAGSDPWMILHNRVYDLKHLIGYHPNGDDIVLAKAGTDATKEFEAFEHSEKARINRDKFCLIGEIVESERRDWLESGSGNFASSLNRTIFSGDLHSSASVVKLWCCMKLPDLIAMCIGTYVYHSVKHRKPLGRTLRQLITAMGILSSLGAGFALSRSKGRS